MKDKKTMTFDELISRFKKAFPFSKIDDYRPVCHELFERGKVGITIGLKNGDMVVYYPNEKAEPKGQLSPCPICHSERIKTMYRKPCNYVKCKDCGAYIYISDTYEERDGMKEAIDTWNRRAEELQQGEEREAFLKGRNYIAKRSDGGAEE